MEENFPNLMKETDMQVQEAQRVPNKMDAKRSISTHTFINVFCCVQCTPMCNVYHVFGPNFQEKNFSFNFLIQFLIYLYLGTYLLYYKGILAFIFERIIYKKFVYVTNNYKTQEQIQGISATAHV